MSWLPVLSLFYAGIAYALPAVDVNHFYSRDVSSGPVVDQNFPDPSLIEVDGTWYSFATRLLSGGNNLPYAVSHDWESWEYTGADAMPSNPAWANQNTPNVWSPDVSAIVSSNSRNFVLYYAALLSGSNKHCIGVATSQSITGPFVPVGNDPLICPTSQGGAIDPAGFVDPADGKRYIVYKIDGNTIGHGGDCSNTKEPIVPTPLLLQQVSSDGLTLVGGPVELLDNRGASDKGTTEAPSLTRASDGTYVLFFSSGCYTDTSYTVSYATASAVTGPYARAATPLFQTGTDGLSAPGGASIAPDANHMVFHQGPFGSRTLYTARVSISGTTVTA